MPEGDTIFRAARTLHRALAGHVVTRFETQYAQLARVHDDAPITGRRVEKIEARGKHLLMHVSGREGPESTGLQSATDNREPATGETQSAIGDRHSRTGAHASRGTPLTSGGAGVRGPLVLRTHMLMSGSWHIYRVGETWQRSPASARIVVGTATFVAVGFSVPIAEFVEEAALETDAAVARLGPDVLSADFDPDAAALRVAASTRATAAEAILEQRAVAGIGNVYKSELLFLAGLHPFLPPAAVTVAQWARVMRDARVLLRANVVDPTEAGVLSYRGSRRTTGQSNPAQRVYVYGRHGRPCRRCGAVIRMRYHGEHNRSTYWCPVCQAAPADQRTES
jgi:endonuclease-8